MKKTKLLILMGACLLPIAGMTSCSNVSFTKKETNCYIPVSSGNNDGSGKLEKVNLYFSSQYEGIPYIEVSEGIKFLDHLNRTVIYDSTSPCPSYNVNYSGNTCKVTREDKDGTYVSFDTSSNTFYSDNLKKFSQSAFKKYSFDILSWDGNFYNEDGSIIPNETKLVKVNDKSSVENQPNSTNVNFNSYNIELVNKDNMCYVPFTTFSNLLFPSVCGFAYNGESLFVISGSLDNTYTYDGKTAKEIYYEGASNRTRSQKLINYNYNELCRHLDYTYGLKESHKINDGFNSYFQNNGVKDLLMSSEKKNLDRGYAEISLSYLADLHSGYDVTNAYGEVYDSEGKPIQDTKAERKMFENDQTNPMPMSPSVSNYFSLTDTIAAERYSNGIIDQDLKINNPIMITDDTIIITFDHFSVSHEPSFYYTDEFINHKEKYIENDTVSLISYANEVINNNPSIHKVVLDVSANGGGVADTAFYVLAWLGSSYIHLIDPINGGSSTMNYLADVNMDKVVDNKDDLTKNSQIKNIYCLTSGQSFSCGNLVPCMLKEIGKVKLIGTTSGGGACSVRYTGCADGTLMQFSSENHLCTLKNGSYYSIDQGAEPDYFVSDYDLIYGGTNGNRSNLVNLLKQMIK